MNMHGDGDVKRLLGRAIGAEPPLRLDRDEVFRLGQRRVRARRIAAAGGVAASVVAVVVSAAAIRGLAGSAPDTVPVVATSPTSTGPGPTSTVVTTTPANPISSTTASPGFGLPIVPPADVPEPTTDAHAASLTATFAAANVIPTEFKVVDSRGLARLGFDRTRGGYQLSAQLFDPRGEGTLVIQIGYLHPDRVSTRCPPLASNSTCDVDASSDIRMLLFTRQHASGSMSYIVEAMRPDGTRTFLETTNLSADGAPGRTRPPLSMAQLKGIAALPGLSFA